MRISDIIAVLEAFAPSAYQESYDNTGLLVGEANEECSGVLCALDTTEEVVLEAKAKNCNLVIAHHPILFNGTKKLNNNNYVERSVIAAIKNDIAIFATHTNLDNIAEGVNKIIADRLGLFKRQPLLAKQNILKKLIAFVPDEHAEKVRDALFSAGAGKLGNYSECSFSSAGTGTFKPLEGSDPFTGALGKLHKEKEVKIEVIFPSHLHNAILESLLKAHPYEEVAYDVLQLANNYRQTGSGLLGELPARMDEVSFLHMLKDEFKVPVIRHTALLHKPILKVAVCGGAGSFLTKHALAAGADVFVTSDVKYHEFFDANAKLVIADIGHYESEQYTIDLLYDILKAKFPTFAILKTEVLTNPVKYFF